MKAKNKIYIVLPVLIRQTPLSLTLDAVIGMKDVALFLPQIPRTLEKESIHLKAALSYRYPG